MVEMLVIIEFSFIGYSRNLLWTSAMRPGSGWVLGMKMVLVDQRRGLVPSLTAAPSRCEINKQRRRYRVNCKGARRTE